MWRTAAFLIALGSALGALTAHGGRLDARLDVLAHFAPVWLAGGLVALVIWLPVKPKGPVVPAFALVAIVAAGALMAPELREPRPRVPAGPNAIKLVQFNVWARNNRWSASERWILAQNADVVVLEEMRAGRPLPAAWTARYPYMTTCGSRSCDTVIYSRFPMIAHRGLVDGSAPYLAAAWATLDAPGGPITVLGVHLSRPTDPELMLPEMARLRAVVRQLPRDRLIVSGDFNLTPWSALLRRQDQDFGLQRITRALPTWPAGPVSALDVPTPFAIMPIDHVYIGPAWRAVSVKRGPRLGSDHYPVVVTLRPSPSQAGGRA